jgi:hypothetical protein
MGILSIRNDTSFKTTSLLTLSPRGAVVRIIKIDNTNKRQAVACPREFPPPEDRWVFLVSL